MSEGIVKDMFSGMSHEAKREVLDRLVAGLMQDLNDDERKEMLRKVAAGEKENRQLTSMVQH